MFSKSTNKAINTALLSTFLISSTTPSYGNASKIDNLTETEAMFGWISYNRVKKKTKHLVKSIEKFKNGKKNIEEITHEIASLKKSATKAFKKNYKVEKIMQLANDKIDT